MRYLFLSLLLLNILYALWELQERSVIPALISTDSAVSSSPVSVHDAPAPVQNPVPVPGVSGDHIEADALCVTLGRFAGEAEAQLLRQRLMALDIGSQIQKRDLVTSTEYWLVMPVVAVDRQQGLAQLAALQDQGIDSFLITRGEFAGNLSLGVFSRKENALARQEQLRDLAQPVRLHSLSSSKAEYWVEVVGDARRLITRALLSRLRADFPNLQHRYEGCRDVAKSRGLT